MHYEAEKLPYHHILGTTYVAFGGLFFRNVEMIMFALLLLNVT